MQMRASDFATGLLKATDIPREPVVTEIVSTRDRMFEGVSKVVLTTTFSRRGLVLNQTRLNELAETLGDEMDGWIGQKIILRRGSATYRGEKVAAIEVKALHASDIPA